MVIGYRSHRKRMQLAKCSGHLPALLPAQGDCEGLRVCVPGNPHVETLVPNVMVPEGGALGGVMRGWVASQGDEETRVLFLPCEDTVRRRQFATGRQSHQNSIKLISAFQLDCGNRFLLSGSHSFTALCYPAPAKPETEQPESRATWASGWLSARSGGRRGG